MKNKSFFPLIIFTLFTSLCLAQTAQQMSANLQALLKSGDIDAQRDVAPVFERIKNSNKEKEISVLVRSLAEIAEKNSGAPTAVREYVRGKLPQVILDFVHGPYTPGARDTVIMLLRSIDASDADTQRGIALAEAEAAKGVSGFANSARLLKLHLERRSGNTTSESRTAMPPARAERQELSFEDRAHLQMKAAQKAMTEQRYEVVRDLMTALETEFKGHDPNFSEKAQWAHVFDFKRFALFELGNKAGAISTCNQAIEVLSGNDWAYLEEYNVVRATLRACHNMLAWETQIGATTAKEIEVAIEHIDTCFDTISPIEAKSVLDAFYNTRAQVYLKANRILGNKYQTELFETLIAASARKVDLSDDANLKKVMQTQAYLNFKKAAQTDLQ